MGALGREWVLISDAMLALRWALEGSLGLELHGYGCEGSGLSVSVKVVVVKVMKALVVGVRLEWEELISLCRAYSSLASPSCLVLV